MLSIPLQAECAKELLLSDVDCKTGLEACGRRHFGCMQTLLQHAPTRALDTSITGATVLHSICHDAEHCSQLVTLILQVDIVVEAHRLPHLVDWS